MDQNQKKIANKILAQRKHLEKLNDWSFWNPPEKLKPSEWLQKNVIVPRSVSGARAGTLRLEPWWKTVIDEAGNATTKEINICSATQTGKTFSSILICLWFLFSQDLPVFVIASDEKLAKEILDERAKQIANASPELAKNIRLKGGRDIRNRIYGLNADLKCGTANSPSSLSSIAAAMILADEVSLYSETLGENVDAIQLVKNRLKSFANSKSLAVFASTPLLEGDLFHRQFTSGIIKRWHFPCPSCSKLSRVDFDRLEYPINSTPKSIEKDPGVILYSCEHCKHKLSQKEFRHEVRKGLWVEDPDQQDKKTSSISFEVPGLLSTIETWETAVIQLLEAGKKPTALQNHYNNCQGKFWKDQRAAITFSELEPCISLKYKAGEIPNSTLGLILGVDTGGTPGKGNGITPDEDGKCLKFQTSLVAILPGGAHHVVEVKEFPNWSALWDGYVQATTFICPDNGAHYDISQVFIDSGGTAKKLGYTTTQAIYALANQYRITPVKGFADLPGIETFKFDKMDNSRKGFGYVDRYEKPIDVLKINVNAWKSQLQALIKAGLFSYPSDYLATDKESVGYIFQKHLTNEVISSTKNKHGVPIPVWTVKREGLPTHWLDSTVYALCGAAAVGIFNHLTWDSYISENGYPWTLGPDEPKEEKQVAPQPIINIPTPTNYNSPW